MRLRSNLVANMAGSAIAGLAAVVVAPLVFRWLGPEAYGLVGFYLIGQTLLLLVDAGMIPAFARAVAWYRGRPAMMGKSVVLLHAFERPLWLVAFSLSFAGWHVAGWVASQWLQPEVLTHQTLIACIRLGLVALALRLVAGLYRVGMLAMERQVESSVIHIVANLMRTFGALWIAVVSGFGIVAFFLVQVVISGAECIIYRYGLRSALPRHEIDMDAGELRGHLRFALGAAGPILLGVAISQADKLALSKTLSLADYGAYSLAVHVASVVVLVAMAIQQAVMPRMTRLFSQGDLGHLRELYGLATGAIISLGCGAIAAIAFAGQGAFALLGQGGQAGAATSLVAVIYAIANLATALASMIYVLQFAQGRLRLYIVGTAALALIQIPLVVLVAQSGKAIATALCYMILGVGYLLAWSPVVHARFLPGGQGDWVKHDVLPPLATGSLIAVPLWLAMNPAGQAATLLAQSALVGAAVFSAALFGHGGLRKEMSRALGRIAEH